MYVLHVGIWEVSFFKYIQLIVSILVLFSFAVVYISAAVHSKKHHELLYDISKELNMLENSELKKQRILRGYSWLTAYHRFTRLSEKKRRNDFQIKRSRFPILALEWLWQTFKITKIAVVDSFYRASACLARRARYCFTISVCQSVCLSVKVKVKVKEADLYSAFIEAPYTQGAQVRITQCYLQTTPYLPLPRKHSPDGASQTEVADI